MFLKFVKHFKNLTLCEPSTDSHSILNKNSSIHFESTDSQLNQEEKIIKKCINIQNRIFKLYTRV